MSGQATRSCQVPVSTVFIFDNSQVQNAANAVYEYKKSYDSYYSTLGKNVRYTFKTDYERMQYKLGLFGRDSTGQR